MLHLQMLTVTTADAHDSKFSNDTEHCVVLMCQLSLLSNGFLKCVGVRCKQRTAADEEHL